MRTTNRHRLLGLALLALLAGCGSGAETAGPTPLADPADFKLGIEHDYFPTEPGRTWILEGHHDGSFRREEVRALEQTREILGIACVAMRQEVQFDGELAELTTEWFAQDVHGNVWKFGEETLEFHGGQFERTTDSWLAGEDEGAPWMALSAEPRVGDVYVGYRPGGIERTEVLSLVETADVPAGRFDNCLQVLEDPEEEDDPDGPDDKDIILYAAGVGRVSESSSAGEVVLVSIEQAR